MNANTLLATGLLLALATPLAPAARAQQSGPSAQRAGGARFIGTVNSTSTTRPVSIADIRLLYVDSVHTAKNSLGISSVDVFVDSAKSRVGITNDSGTFAIRNIIPGRYLINVRRIGFAPFEGAVTIDTAMVEMELALNQLTTELPPVRVTGVGTNRVMVRLDRVGFISRSHMGTSGRFIDRGEILKRKPTYVTDLLQAYGIGSDASFTMDRFGTDWETLRDYPVELVIGIEIYRHRGSLPTEFDATRGGSLSMGRDGTGGASAPTVLIWTYIP
jgi:hypothetical protein